MSGNASLLHIGGKNATDASGRIVGAGDLGAQTRRTLENLRTILKAEGAGFEDLVKMNIYLLAGPIRASVFGPTRRLWGN